MEVAFALKGNVWFMMYRDSVDYRPLVTFRTRLFSDLIA